MTQILLNSNLDTIPEGFRPIQVGGHFMVHNGPLYGKWTGRRLLLGFRVEERHTNPLKICHGGMLAIFADMLIPCASMYQSDMATDPLGLQQANVPA